MKLMPHLRVLNRQNIPTFRQLNPKGACAITVLIEKMKVAKTTLVNF